MKRREYRISPIFVNKVWINRVLIDPHFESKHGEQISDHLIIELVKGLNWRLELAEARDKKGYSYFVTLLKLNERQYRLIWLMEADLDYLGVINAYRDDRKR